MRLELSAPDYYDALPAQSASEAPSASGPARRGWRKLHLGVDQSGVIRVHTLTEATGDDATTALDLLTAVEGPTGLRLAPDTALSS